MICLSPSRFLTVGFGSDSLLVLPSKSNAQSHVLELFFVTYEATRGFYTSRVLDGYPFFFLFLSKKGKFGRPIVTILPV